MTVPVDERLILELARAAGGSLPSSVEIPPGDDMAMIRLSSSRLLVAADQTIAGLHFTPETPLHLVARKAVARNVSDVAAMAAHPVATIACATIPGSMSEADATALFHALTSAANEFGCPLIGGDTTIDPRPDARLALAVTILAEPRADGLVGTRSGAREGDTIIVSGAVGGAFGRDGLGHHLTFAPRVREAHALVDALGANVHAMIDISDGVALDLSRLLTASGESRGHALAARLHAESIPLREGATLPTALGDGEDYELLAAIAPGSALPSGWAAIGTVTTRVGSTAPSVTLVLDGVDHDVSDLGFRHDPRARHA